MKALQPSMLAVAGRGQIRGHSVIDFIYTGGYGAEQTAAAYDDRDVGEFHSILLQSRQDGLLTELELVDDPLVLRDFLGRVPECLGKYFFFPLEKSYLGRSGTGVYCQYICHDSPVLFCCKRCECY